MQFRIRGLSPQPFQALFALSEADLLTQNVKRYIADDEDGGYPDRIAMRHAQPGEVVLLLNYLYLPEHTPYRASHAIFVAEGSKQAYDQINEVPDVMRQRLLSLRAFDANHMMIDADIVDGLAVEALIERLFSNRDTSYIQAHYARRGCYAGRIDRHSDASFDPVI